MNNEAKPEQPKQACVPPEAEPAATPDPGSGSTLQDIHVDPENARTRDRHARRSLRKSVRKFGLARSIVVDKDNKILAGNGTFETAKALGKEKVRFVDTVGDELVVVRRTDLEGERAQAYAIADNRTGDLSEFDEEALINQLSSMKEFDPDEVGFDDEDMDELIGEIEEEIKRDVSFTVTESTGESASREEVKDVMKVYSILVTCETEAEQGKLFEELQKRGVRCQISTL